MPRRLRGRGKRRRRRVRGRRGPDQPACRRAPRRSSCAPRRPGTSPRRGQHAACAARQRGDVAAPAPRRRSLACRDVNDRDVNAPVVAKAAPPAPAPPPRPAEPPAPAEPVAPPRRHLPAATRRAASASRGTRRRRLGLAPEGRAGGRLLRGARTSTRSSSSPSTTPRRATSTAWRRRPPRPRTRASGPSRASSPPFARWPYPRAGPPPPLEPPSDPRAAGTARRSAESAGACAAVAAAECVCLGKTTAPRSSVRPRLPLGMHRRTGRPHARRRRRGGRSGVVPALQRAREPRPLQGRQADLWPPAEGAEKKKAPRAQAAAGPPSRRSAPTRRLRPTGTTWAPQRRHREKRVKSREEEETGPRRARPLSRAATAAAAGPAT